MLNSHLNGMGFAVYVDDILLAGKSAQQITEVKRDLGSQFYVKDMGAVDYFPRSKGTPRFEQGSSLDGSTIIY